LTEKGRKTISARVALKIYTLKALIKINITPTTNPGYGFILDN